MPAPDTHAPGPRPGERRLIDVEHDDERSAWRGCGPLFGAGPGPGQRRVLAELRRRRGAGAVGGALLVPEVTRRGSCASLPPGQALAAGHGHRPGREVGSEGRPDPRHGPPSLWCGGDKSKCFAGCRDTPQAGLRLLKTHGLLSHRAQQRPQGRGHREATGAAVLSGLSSVVSSCAGEWLVPVRPRGPGEGAEMPPGNSRRDHPGSAWHQETMAQMDDGLLTPGQYRPRAAW